MVQYVIFVMITPNLGYERVVTPIIKYPSMGLVLSHLFLRSIIAIVGFQYTISKIWKLDWQPYLVANKNVTIHGEDCTLSSLCTMGVACIVLSWIIIGIDKGYVVR